MHAPWAGAVVAHAVRALGARAAYAAAPARPGDGAVAGALARAAALWDAGLFFEVHEVLEAVWKTERGDVRQALQGLIQIGVAFHHLAHGNPRGARSLLVEGRARLASVPLPTLPAVDVARLLEETEGAAESLAAHAAPAAAAPRFPRR